MTPSTREQAKVAQQRAAQEQQAAEAKRVGPGPARPVVHCTSN